jgi:threonine dehydratase
MSGGLAEVLGPRGVDVVGVQPAANCAMHDSLRRGAALTTYAGGHTIAEGCEGAVAERTYRRFATFGAGVALVDELAIERAVVWAERELGQRVEPTGAVALAGLLEGVVTAGPHGATVCILSGGNR